MMSVFFASFSRRLTLASLALLVLAPSLKAQVEGREWEEIGAPKKVEKFLKHMPEGTESGKVMVPMRDGVKLASNIFIPPGEGPWPVILVKGFYGRFGTSGYARHCKDGEFVFVAQDARDAGDSEGKGTYDASSFDIHVKDSADALKWIAGQPWCNGKIGLYGGSGNGVAPYTAFLSGSPHLTIAAPGNSSGTSWYWMYDNRVRRGLYDWMRHVKLKVSSWPRPTIAPLSYEDNLEQLRSYQPNPDSVLVASGAWYDIVGESALDMFAAFADKAHVFVKISPRWHGGRTEIQGERWSNDMQEGVKRPDFPDFDEYLAGQEGVPGKSQLQYYLMGDPTDPDSLGNEWRVSDVWPVPHTPTPFFLNAAGGIGATRPAGAGSLSYTYDPRDPAPAAGGNSSFSIPMGPADQRFLQARDDVLRFVSEPLTEPLTFVGKIHADLYFSSSAPDTLFVVKVVDIYPDGYEAILRESAGMGRFAEGLDGTTPLEPGKVYRLKLDLWSTANVLNPGHRLGVYITSSAKLDEEVRGEHREAPVYEIHPNTFEQVNSMDEAQVAEQTLHFSTEHPTSVILPLVSE